MPDLSFKGLLDFSGKTVVITGGMGLIGRQVAMAFQEFGGSVVIADIDESSFSTTFGSKPDVSFARLDIGDPGSITDGVTGIVERHGQIDVCVNLAYPRTGDWMKPLAEVTFDSWDANVRSHLGGYFWASKTILEHMKKNRSGSLINCGSVYGVLGPHFDVYGETGLTTPVAYSAIKAGIVNLSRYFATYYGPDNVRVNCICPGGVLNGQARDFVNRYSAQTPLGRMAQDHEIAMPFMFLGSQAASYITGQVLMVDGGWSAW